MLNTVSEGETVDYYKLRNVGVAPKINKQRDIFKVVSRGELTVKGLTVSAHAFTESARAAIEAAGLLCRFVSY